LPILKIATNGIGPFEVAHTETGIGDKFFLHPNTRFLHPNTNILIP